MEDKTKYPFIKYNDIYRSRIVIWQVADDRFCLMHWPMPHHSEFVATFRTYNGATSYMYQEFAPLPLPR